VRRRRARKHGDVKDAKQSSEPAAPASPMRYFRLPARGPDPIYGLTRSFFYQLEKRGELRLIRLREKGRLRGVTLVPVDAVEAYIRAQAGQESAAAAAELPRAESCA